MSADVIALDVLSNTEVFYGANRICSRSESPQKNAGKVLRSMDIPLTATVHFRRYGHIVRRVVLERLLRDDEQ
jgi:hypothetical protein